MMTTRILNGIEMKNLIAVPTALIQPVASREVRYLAGRRD